MGEEDEGLREEWERGSLDDWRILELCLLDICISNFSSFRSLEKTTAWVNRQKKKYCDLYSRTWIRADHASTRKETRQNSWEARKLIEKRDGTGWGKEFKRDRGKVYC